jgi:hypothetical protein
MSGIAPNFFETMQIPLVAGRQFTGYDNRPEAPKVAIINEAGAKKFFPAENPVGQIISVEHIYPAIENRAIALRDRRGCEGYQAL